MADLARTGKTPRNGFGPNALQALSFHRRTPREQHIERCPQSVDVARRPELVDEPRGLFGAHEGGRADHVAEFGRRGRIGNRGTDG